MPVVSLCLKCLLHLSTAIKMLILHVAGHIMRPSSINCEGEEIIGLCVWIKNFPFLGRTGEGVIPREKMRKFKDSI